MAGAFAVLRAANGLVGREFLTFEKGEIASVGEGPNGIIVHNNPNGRLEIWCRRNAEGVWYFSARRDFPEAFSALSGMGTILTKLYEWVLIAARAAQHSIFYCLRIANYGKATLRCEVSTSGNKRPH